MKEEWRAVPGYEGLYEVSNMGRVRSLPRVIVYKDGRSRFDKGRVLSMSGGKNYRLVTLGSRNIPVHRIVAEVFVPNPNNLPIVNHINEARWDNRADNLEWCTQRHNLTCGNVQVKCSKGYLHLKKEVEQRDINGNLLNTFNSMGEAARSVGLSVGNICMCCKEPDRHKTAGGYKWNYKKNDIL